MRFDSIGLFWEDKPTIKTKKEKIVREPPEPVWENDDYLPYLEEACQFVPNYYSDAELTTAWLTGEKLTYDIESYPNYFSIGFQGIDTGKQLLFEADENGIYYDVNKLKWVLENLTLIGFNCEHYDRWIAAVACAKNGAASMWAATDRIIKMKEKGYFVIRSFKAKNLKINHIDVIELTPLHPSLKKMAGRLQSELMMDLPFPPGKILNGNQKTITRWYMFNDLRNTELVYRAHEKNIALREQVGPEYGIDLRSKSDAQIAEAIYRSEVKRITGRKVRDTIIEPGKTFQFQVPTWAAFQSENLQWVLEQIRNSVFMIGDSGYVISPDTIEGITIPIGKATYKIGIGGLHSQEKNAAYVAIPGKTRLRDFDVAGYYPELMEYAMTTYGMEPPQLIGIFSELFPKFKRIRKEAKRAGNVTVADTFKIVNNGSFGKTMDPWSCLYCPEFGIQTTLSGQIALLMAIEALEMSNIQVTNANTDGIVVYSKVEDDATIDSIFAWWGSATGLEMDISEYRATFSRDVNNYIAFKTNGDVKSKGVFGEGGIKHDPNNEICARAVLAYMFDGVPIADTVNGSRDIKDFIAIKQAAGGAVKCRDDGSVEFIGKVARWYHSINDPGPIITAKKGHMVATTEDCRPLMRFTKNFPDDMNFEWYIEEAEKLVEQIGYNDLTQAEQRQLRVKENHASPTH